MRAISDANRTYSVSNYHGVEIKIMLNWEIDQFAFIKGATEDQICAELIKLSSSESMKQTFEVGQPSHTASSLQSRDWTIQVLTGNDGWVLLRSSPRYLFVESPTCCNAPRFTTICNNLGVAGFMLIGTNYERQAGWILLEAENNGETLVSGYWLDDYDTSDGKNFFGYALDTKECPWVISPRSKLLKDLIQKVNSNAVNDTGSEKISKEDLGSYSVLRDELTPILMNFESYEITQNFGKTGGKTLFFTSIS